MSSSGSPMRPGCGVGLEFQFCCGRGTGHSRRADHIDGDAGRRPPEQCARRRNAGAVVSSVPMRIDPVERRHVDGGQPFGHQRARIAQSGPRKMSRPPASSGLVLGLSAAPGVVDERQRAEVIDGDRDRRLDLAFISDMHQPECRRGRVGDGTSISGLISATIPLAPSAANTRNVTRTDAITGPGDERDLSVRLTCRAVGLGIADHFLRFAHAAPPRRRPSRTGLHCRCA